MLFLNYHFWCVQLQNATGVRLSPPVATWVNQALAALIAWWGGGAAVVVTAVAVWRTLRFFRRPAATFWYLLAT
jgi:hypothetical protein